MNEREEKTDRENGGAHLTDGEIVAYNYGNLPSAEDVRRAQNHFVECRRCTNLLLELNEFAESAAAAASFPNGENSDKRWAQFQGKLAAEKIPLRQNAASENAPAEAGERRRSFFDFRAFNFARAAAAFALFLALLGAAAFFLARRSSETAKRLSPETPNRKPKQPPRIKTANGKTLPDK